MSLWSKMIKHTSSSWCCHLFQQLYERAGQRGFSAIVKVTSTGPIFFVLQFRAVDKGLEPDVSKSSLPLLMVSEMALHYCPSCGTNLDDYYRDTMEGLYRAGLAIEF